MRELRIQRFGTFTCAWLKGEPVDLLGDDPLRPAHARRQLEAEVSEQLRHAGIVQNPRQRLPNTLPRPCSIVYSYLSRNSASCLRRCKRRYSRISATSG